MTATLSYEAQLELRICTCMPGHRCQPCDERARAHHRFYSIAATFHGDIRKQTHPVEWANRQTSYHDCRIALCVAVGVPLERVHPVTGHDMRGVA
jgi:hypothetical protein